MLIYKTIIRNEAPLAPLKFFIELLTFEFAMVDEFPCCINCAVTLIVFVVVCEVFPPHINEQEERFGAYWSVSASNPE